MSVTDVVVTPQDFRSVTCDARPHSLELGVGSVNAVTAGRGKVDGTDGVMSKLMMSNEFIYLR